MRGEVWFNRDYRSQEWIDVAVRVLACGRACRYARIDA